MVETFAQSKQRLSIHDCSEASSHTSRRYPSAMPLNLRLNNDELSLLIQHIPGKSHCSSTKRWLNFLPNRGTTGLATLISEDWLLASPSYSMSITIQRYNDFDISRSLLLNVSMSLHALVNPELIPRHREVVQDALRRYILYTLIVY
jgi:hypothetical protein